MPLILALACLTSQTEKAAQAWESVVVPSLTLDDLLKAHNVQSIDFLSIDCEGHDYTILKAFSFTVRPRLIMVEHAHHKAPKKAVFDALMAERGYQEIFLNEANVAYQSCR